jgi:hypothetical protein
MSPGEALGVDKTGPVHFVTLVADPDRRQSAVSRVITANRHIKDAGKLLCVGREPSCS